MASPFSDKSVSLAQAEHISPVKTGDNIAAKKVANYVWNSETSEWERQSSAINALVPYEYDYISLSYTGDNITGVVYKTGGSGGTTVATLTIAYSGTKITSVTRT